MATPTEMKMNHLRERLDYIHYENFYDRPESMPISMYQLKMMIAYRLYGSPFNFQPEMPRRAYLRRLYDGEGDMFLEYPLQAQKNVTNAVNVIKTKILRVRSDDTEVDVGLTFVHTVCAEACSVCADFPNNDVHQWLILRIRVDRRRTVFYDVQHDGVYEKWINFLTCNNLPKGHMFYMDSGMYVTGCKIRQRATPALIMDILNVSALITTSLMAASVSFPCMSFMKQPAVVLASILSAWCKARATIHPKDRNNNNLSLYIDDEQQSWQKLAQTLMTIVGAQLDIANEWNRDSAVTLVYQQHMKQLYSLAELNVMHNF